VLKDQAVLKLLMLSSLSTRLDKALQHYIAKQQEKMVSQMSSLRVFDSCAGLQSLCMPFQLLSSAEMTATLYSHSIVIQSNCCCLATFIGQR
jgi:hypothetical protein